MLRRCGAGYRVGRVVRQAGVGDGSPKALRHADAALEVVVDVVRRLFPGRLQARLQLVVGGGCRSPRRHAGTPAEVHVRFWSRTSPAETLVCVVLPWRPAWLLSSCCPFPAGRQRCRIRLQADGDTPCTVHPGQRARLRVLTPAGHTVRSDLASSAGLVLQSSALLGGDTTVTWLGTLAR